MKKGEKHLIGSKTDFIWNIAKNKQKLVKIYIEPVNEVTKSSSQIRS